MWGAWVAQYVKLPNLGFGSGHDLTIEEMEFPVRLCVDRMGFSLPSFSAPPILFLKINKVKNKTKQKKSTRL